MPHLVKMKAKFTYILYPAQSSAFQNRVPNSSLCFLCTRSMKLFLSLYFEGLKIAIKHLTLEDPNCQTVNRSSIWPRIDWTSAGV